jgi:uncharacterized repeat protein (TIGR01451 family)
MKIARFVGVCFFIVATGVITSATPAAAMELGNRTVVDHTDFASFGVGGMRGTGTGTIAVTGVSGTVTKALLYWNGPTNGGSSVNAAVSFAGNSVSGTNIGTSSDNCWSFTNSQSYRAVVTSYVSGNGSYALSNFRKTGPPVAEINGASLIVFFNDGNGANNRDVTIVDGNDSNFTNPNDSAGWNSTISGVQYASETTAHLQLHVSDGQSYPDDAVRINGQPFLSQDNNFEGDTVPGTFTGNATGVTGNLWDIKNYDISSFLVPGSNDLNLTSPYLNDCLSLVAALVDVPSATAAQADLSVAQTASPTSVSPGAPVQFLVTVTNNGPDDASGVTETNAVTGGTISSATPSQGTCNSAGTQCSLGDIAQAGTATVKLVVTSGPSGSVQNVASATADSPSDPNTENNTATTSATILSQTGQVDNAAGFYDGSPLDIQTVFGSKDSFKSEIFVPSSTGNDGYQAGPVTDQERSAKLPAYITFCGKTQCDAQVDVSSLPSGSQANTTGDPGAPIQVILYYKDDAINGDAVYAQGDNQTGSHLLSRCDSPTVATVNHIVTKCVASITTTTGKDKIKKIVVLVPSGNDPTIGKH